MSNAVRSMIDFNKNATFIDRPDFLEINFGNAEAISVVNAATRISERVGKPVKAVRVPSKARSDITWFTNGANYNPFGPSCVETGPGQFKEVWTNAEGKWHRVDGPSKVERGAISERTEWRQNNQLHRDDGPAVSVVCYDLDWPRHCKFGDLPKSFTVHEDHRALFLATEHVNLYSSREYGSYQHGKRHSLNDRAAMVSEMEVIEKINLLETGTILKKTYSDAKSWTWYSEEHLHRTSGPARITLTNCYEEWRDDVLITRRCTGWEVEWIINGEKLRNHDVNEWLSRHNVLLISPYEIDGTVWREQQDEFAFMMDFQKIVKRAA